MRTMKLRIYPGWVRDQDVFALFITGTYGEWDHTYESVENAIEAAWAHFSQSDDAVLELTINRGVKT